MLMGCPATDMASSCNITNCGRVCKYIPPSISHDDLNSFYEYFFYCCDILKSESPDNPRVINSQCNLKQVVKHPARNSVILDLIMSDIHKFYQEPLVLAPIGGSDHCTIVWSSKVQLQPQKVSKRINVRPLKSSSLLAFGNFEENY